MSQPSRAVMWFLEVNRIPYEFRLVRIMKGQHLSDQYATMYVHHFSSPPLSLSLAASLIT